MNTKEIEEIQFLCKKCGEISYIIIDNNDTDIRDIFKKIEATHKIKNHICQYDPNKILIINPFAEIN